MSDETTLEGELLESCQPKNKDPELEAVETFDLGLDEVVSGLKKMGAATSRLRVIEPRFEGIEKSITEGVLPWLEKVDDDFSEIYPEAEE